MSTNASIKIGESGAAFVKRNPGLVNTYQSIPNVVQDYNIKWTERPRGQVRIDHGQHSFTVNDVFSVITDEDLTGQSTHEGLFSVNITAGMSVSAPGFIAHDQARLKTYEMLQSIMAAGWRQVIERSEPRLRGKTRFEYTLATTNINGLDATYVPTFEEWMRIENRTPYSFYADGLYMEVTLSRSPEHMDPKEPGVYLLNIDIKTDTEYFRGFAGPDKRDQWKDVVPGELVKVAKLRADKEAELRAKGITIDESYQDPPIPTFK